MIHTYVETPRVGSQPSTGRAIVDPNSPIIWAVRIVIVTLLATFGYNKAAAYEREFGVTPWSLAKGMWAFLWALGLLPGVILWLIAKATTKHAPPPVPTYVSPQLSGPQFGTPHLAGSQFGSAPSSMPTSAAAMGLNDAGLFGPATPTSPPAQPAQPPLLH